MTMKSIRLLSLRPPAAETVSWLMDNAISSGTEHHQAVQTLADNPVVQHYWQRYHLIGDIMRHEVVTPLSPPLLLNRIQVALAQDPPLNILPAPPSPPVSGFKKYLKKYKISQNSLRWLSPLASAALAATVATIAILGLQQVTLESAGEPVPLLAYQVTPPVMQAPLAQFPQVPAASMVSWDRAQPAVAKELDRYWLGHNELMIPVGAQSLK